MPYHRDFPLDLSGNRVNYHCKVSLLSDPLGEIYAPIEDDADIKLIRRV